MQDINYFCVMKIVSRESPEPKSPVSGSMVSHMPLSDSAWIHGKKGFLENPRKFTRGKPC
jgi:hypothetical protein